MLQTCVLVILALGINAQNSTAPPRCRPRLFPISDPRNCPDRGIWGLWREKTACTDVCGGFGNKTIERTCLSPPRCGNNCVGPSTKVVKCNASPCPFPRNSCDAGMTATAKGSQILCADPNETQEQFTTSCCPRRDIMEWSDWSPCPAQCGSCAEQTRKRTCVSARYGCTCTAQDTIETRPCYTAPCVFPQQSCCKSYQAKASNGQILCM